jgi:predicted enzyme related to lactoylglutathione lyase
VSNVFPPSDDVDTMQKFGVVIFTGDVDRLTRFYQEVAGLKRVSRDKTHAVLESATFQVVVHAISGEATPTNPPTAREDGYIKPFFPVKRLAEARERAATLGGMLRSPSAEWEARGFRACDGTDPDGNVIQCRESAG